MVNQALGELILRNLFDTLSRATTSANIQHFLLKFKLGNFKFDLECEGPLMYSILYRVQRSLPTFSIFILKFKLGKFKL